MADPLAVFSNITRSKAFKDPDLDAAITAMNDYVAGTLEIDPDHVYASMVSGAYWDGANNVIILTYTYLMPYPAI